MEVCVPVLSLINEDSDERAARKLETGVTKMLRERFTFTVADYVSMDCPSNPLIILLRTTKL
jgi:hypothetical protein